MPQCLDRRDPDGCSGPVEYREPLSATGTSYARCERHWSGRVGRQAEIRRDYPDSDVPPAWFDSTYAGERWDEDD